MSSNVEIVTDLYAAYQSGDLDAIRARLAADLVVAQSPGLPWSGAYHGTDGFFQFIGMLLSHIETEVHTEHIYDAGDAVVQVGRTVGRIRANGATFDAPEVHVLTLRDSKIVHFQVYVDVDQMLSALHRQASA